MPNFLNGKDAFLVDILHTYGASGFHGEGLLLKCDGARLKAVYRGAGLVMQGSQLYEGHPEWMPDDAHCCPSLSVTTPVRLVGETFQTGEPTVSVSDIEPKKSMAGASSMKKIAGRYTWSFGSFRFIDRLFPDGGLARRDAKEGEWGWTEWKYGRWKINRQSGQMFIDMEFVEDENWGELGIVLRVVDNKGVLTLEAIDDAGHVEKAQKGAL